MKLKLALLLLAAWPLAAQAQDCPPLVKIASVKLEPLANSRRVLVPVTINNVPKKFLLDTAGLAGFITKEAADELKLPSVSFSSNVRPIKTFGLGGRTFELPATDTNDTTLISSPSPTSSDRAGDIDGTLVNSFLLNKGELDIDFPGKTLSLFSPNHCPGNVNHWGAADIGFLPLRTDTIKIGPTLTGFLIPSDIKFKNDIGHLTVPVTLDGHSLNGWIDTSAEKSYISIEVAERIFNLREGDLGPTSEVILAPDSVVGFLGHKSDKVAKGFEAYRRKFSMLSVGHVDIKNLEFLIVPDGEGRNNDPVRWINYMPQMFVKTIWQDVFDRTGWYTRIPGVQVRSRIGKKLAGFTNAKNDVPDMVLGMDVLRHLHIYLSIKEKRMYFSAASTPPPPSPTPVNTAPVLAPPSQEIPVSRPLPPIGPSPSRLAADAVFNDAKLKCAELGFKTGTEKFGTCVLKLSK